MAILQETRLLAIKTALGPNTLAIRTLAVREQISRLFEIDVDLSSEDGDINFDAVVGFEATIRLDVGQKEQRFFHGYVSRFVQLANQDGYAHYEATIVPWLWFLTRTSDCRVFQNKTVPEILREMFQKHGGDVRFNLTGNYQPKEFCVQYRETDFNFVSRLMEQEGIYYFFQHEDGKHHLIVADSISAHRPFAGYEEISFHELEQGAMAREVITDWTAEKEVQPVAYALTDFDFTKPRTNLLSSTQVTRKHGRARYEVFDFPGEYFQGAAGERLADVRLNELQAQLDVFHGQATARGLTAGSTFKLKNHPRADQNGEYLITGTSIRADAGEFASNANGGDFFSCSFTAIPQARQFRPARLTPKPIVQGPQTAIVVGPAGEEIYTDKYGRVKLHFHWDRHDQSDENSSWWVRVSQFWAGKEWGSIHIPRIGQEVIVEFLEGDPDCPIITGRVYNAEQITPYSLPANKTQSGWKSRSTKGGSTANFNEIRFEDKKGSEEVYIHAEKDQNNVVEHDHSRWVGHDESIHIGNDRTLKVDRDKSELVGRNKTIRVDGFHEETIEGSQTIAVGANLSENVGINYSEVVGAAMEITVGAAMAISVGAALAETVGLTKAETIGSSKTETIGGNKTLRTGKDFNQHVAKNLSVKVGADVAEEVGGQHKESIKKEYILQAQKIQFLAEDEISIKTGDAEITMKKNGDVTINGKKINVKGSGDVTIKGSKIAEN
jgi:type VI secretion system secreted protein VgrG